MTATPFNKLNQEHCQIIKEAVHNADQFGAGRLTAVLTALDDYNISYTEKQVSDYIFNTFVLTD